jgi:tetratricopeptide (TPR) repeat protein
VRSQITPQPSASTQTTPKLTTNAASSTAATSEITQRKEADFDRAIEINPNYGDAYYNRAKVRYFLEDKPGAIADYQKAAELSQKSGNTNDDRDAINHIQRLPK